jgi:RNA polymerase sigma-70 factor (ECF subfamily)
MNNKEDSQLIADYLAGDKPALEVLFARYLNPVFYFVYRYVGDEEEAQEIVQLTFIKVWKNLRKFKPEKKFKTWIFTIAKNTALDFLRKKKNPTFSELLDREKGEREFELAVDTAPLPPEIFDREQLSEAVESAINRLAPYYREVLHLYFMEQLTFQEIAEILDEPLNTVKSRQRRALIELRKLINLTPPSP